MCCSLTSFRPGWRLLTGVAMLLVVAGVAQAADAPQVTTQWSSADGLAVSVKLAGVACDEYSTANGQYVSVSWPEAQWDAAVGAPALPIVRRLFVTPVGADVSVIVKAGAAERRLLAAPVWPWQAAVPIGDESVAEVPFAFDMSAYATANRSRPLVTTTPIGVVRGHQLHMLEIRPLAYDASANELKIWSDISVTLSFAGGEPCTRDLGWLSNARSILNPPARVLRDTPNFLIVVSEKYDGTTPMTQFIAAKQAQGFNVLTNVISQNTNATNIKNGISAYWGTANEPDYVLLVGEGKDDGYEIPDWSGGGASGAPTDLPYVCMDGSSDWYPDIPIGRFSVGTEAQLQAVVDKTLYIEDAGFTSQAFLTRAAFMAGTDTDSGDHDAHEYIITNHLDPEGFTCDRNYERAPYNAVTQDVTDSFNAGLAFGGYYGHSWGDAWEDGPYFSTANIQGLSSGGYCIFLLHMTCNVNRYETFDECFAESWLRAAGKGAVTTVGSSKTIYYANNPGWPETSLLYTSVFDAIYDDDIREVGPAWQAALYALLDTYGPAADVSRDYFEMFNLLGDPSLRIPRPAGFTLDVDPATESVCAGDSAVYTIDVGAELGFSDAVTFSVLGNPGDTLAGIAPNPATPPTTVTLTVLTVPGTVPGDFVLEVTGQAGAQNEMVEVDLHISNSAPGVATLESPTNGETDVSMTPLFDWQAVSQAVTYDFELATDAGFSSVLHSATVSDDSYQLPISLDSGTEYFWRIAVTNGCGASGWSSGYSFTTRANPDYFTEQFDAADFDLAYSTLTLTPDGSDDYYSACLSSASAFPVDPSSHTELSLRNDNYEQIILAESRTVGLYTLSHTTFYVCANGYITFDTGDGDYNETIAKHFKLKRIAPFYHDLDPSVSGRVSWMQLTDRAVVTFENVPEYNMSNSNSFQVEMFFDGVIRITWLNVDSTDAIVGLSEGLGTPGDFTESDLSAYDSCCDGDLNGDGTVGLADLQILLSNYGTLSGAGYEDGDLNGDGAVNLADLQLLLSFYGTVC